MLLIRKPLVPEAETVSQEQNNYKDKYKYASVHRIQNIAIPPSKRGAYFPVMFHLSQDRYFPNSLNMSQT